MTTHDAALLQAWETARHRSAPQRSAALLRLASDEPFGELSLAESERLLLRWRTRQFGPRLACVANCLDCGEPFEFELDARDLSTAEAAPPLRIADRNHCIDVRRPTIDDCIAMAETHDAESAYALLLQRCVAARAPDGTAIAAADLPPESLEAVDAQWALADAADALSLSLTCPNCDRPANARLDVAAFCWAEIERHAQRVLQEVHGLASRYGWREADILAMSRQRRAHYLDLAGT
jgi:hypothetical protein